jgi:hypothetical protein
MYKLLEPISNKVLAEANQNLIIKFSFATLDEENKTVQRLHEWCMCRDFLGDVIFANATKKTTNIYSFEVNPDIVKIDPTRTILVIKFDELKSKQAFKANYLHIVHEVEKKNQLSLTALLPTTNPQEIIVVADKFWQQAVGLISLYSFLLKAACFPYKNVVRWRDEIVARGVVESHYMSKVYKAWEPLIDKLHKIFYKKSVTGIKAECPQYITTVHNNAGFVSIMGNYSFMKETNSYAARVAKLMEGVAT